MTFELGRMRTCRLPARSALPRLLRHCRDVSFRSCLGVPQRQSTVSTGASQRRSHATKVIAKRVKNTEAQRGVGSRSATEYRPRPARTRVAPPVTPPDGDQRRAGEQRDEPSAPAETPRPPATSPCAASVRLARPSADPRPPDVREQPRIAVVRTSASTEVRTLRGSARLRARVDAHAGLVCESHRIVRRGSKKHLAHRAARDLARKSSAREAVSLQRSRYVRIRCDCDGAMRFARHRRLRALRVAWHCAASCAPGRAHARCALAPMRGPIGARNGRPALELAALDQAPMVARRRCAD